jgi:hypothetical protein
MFYALAAACLEAEERVTSMAQGTTSVTMAGANVSRRWPSIYPGHGGQSFLEG